jgi:hypothetical protein
MQPARAGPGTPSPLPFTPQCNERLTPYTSA